MEVDAVERKVLEGKQKLSDGGCASRVVLCQGKDWS